MSKMTPCVRNEGVGADELLLACGACREALAVVEDFSQGIDVEELDELWVAHVRRNELLIERQG